ncbi:MAG TPA: anthranilate phosphoribosyltransferase [Thermoanaerobaculia bacterium]|nr:anthranilate phosphoribosyltransferase [Thermoanaerobaculia bacterium]
MTTAAHRALHAVARGARLTREDARSAISALLDEEIPAAIAGGLLSALAAMGETVEAVAGAVDVLRARATRPPVDRALAARAIDVCGTGGDGLGTFNVSTAAGFVAAGAGAVVAKHGNRAVSSACGSADVLTALGVDIEMSPALAAEALARANVTFFFAPLYHPVMKKVGPLRRELGLRTVFNLAGPLSNPAGVTRQIVGVDRPERVPVIAGALAALGAEHALVFSHETGGDELLPFGRTFAAEVRGSDVELLQLGAVDFGLDEGSPDALRGGDAEANAEILRAIVRGFRRDTRSVVLMNASAALVVAGVAADFREGVARADAALEEGKAEAALDALVRISRGETS